MNRIERVFASLIIFLGGFTWALPVTVEGAFEFSPWAQQIEVLHGVTLKEALFLMFLGAFVLGGAVQGVRFRQDALRYALSISALGIAGIASTILNPYRLWDMGQAARFFLLATYFLALVHWTRTSGRTFALRWFLTGTSAGGVINLLYTFRGSYLTVGSLPALLGQNGPGGILGLSVALGAWLMLIRQRRADSVVAIIAAAVGLCGAAISYSKLAMLMALCGLIAWCAVAISQFGARKSFHIGALLAGLAIAVFIGLSRTTGGGEVSYSLGQFIYYKFSGIDAEDESLASRYMYLPAVAEIFAEHPLFGVGYSGFYDAVTATSAYSSGRMGEEDPESGRLGLSNPHNSFLYYVSANGTPGLILVIILFVWFLRALRRSLLPYSAAGVTVWVCLSTAYFIHGMTLPSLFNTEVMYLPAAIAFSQLAARSNRQRLIDVAAPRLNKSGRVSAPLIETKMHLRRRL